MAVTEPCYTTREEVTRALDIKVTARTNEQVDRTIQAASRTVESLMHRVFYPTITTNYFDWPNFQSAYPWRIWFDEAELADVTGNVPVVTSGGNVIPNASIFWGHPRYTPPFTYMELSRATSATFGQGNTPQRDVAIVGTFGFWVKTAPAGTLGVALTDTTGTVVQVSNGAAVGVGDNILVDTERMLVQEKTTVNTTQTFMGAGGGGTANLADNLLLVSDGTKFNINEVILIDAERMLIVDITGNNLLVKRAWDGTVLAVHFNGAAIYAYRNLTVVRGALGTTAGTHLISTAVNVALVPSLIKDLAVGEALNVLLQEQSGYARTQGQGAGAQTNVGMSLDAIRKQAFALYGRKARSRVV